MESIRPNLQRAKNAKIMVYVVMIASIILLISTYLQSELLAKVARGEIITVEDADANDQRQAMISFLYLVVFIISAITFIQWFRRAYFNLHLKSKNLSSSEGWAAGCWFVPVLNLFKPYQIMNEMFKETKAILQNRNNADEKLSTGIVGLWWTLWIINSLTGYYVNVFDKNNASLDSLQNITYVGMFSAAIVIILAPITAKMISNYSAAEKILAEETDNSESSTYNSLIG